MRPPWFTERLLDKFIDDDVSEDVLGDLAEEWHERAGHQGTGAASWWYRKQAAKSLVHLVALGWRPATVVGLIGAALVVGLPLFLFTGWAGDRRLGGVAGRAGPAIVPL